MKITWHGHSCFTIQGKDATLVTDPFSPELGLPVPRLKADIVTVSHQHNDHNYLKTVEGNYLLCEWPGEYESKEVQVMGFPAFHYAKSEGISGENRGKIIIFEIIIDGFRICHLGDLGHNLTSELTEQIGDIDILLVPVGGGETIDAKKAHQVIEQIDPKIIIPMHYKLEGIKVELDPVNNFLKELGKEYKPEPFFQAKKAADLPAETTECVVLEAKN